MFQTTKVIFKQPLLVLMIHYMLETLLLTTILIILLIMMVLTISALTCRTMLISMKQTS